MFYDYTYMNTGWNRQKRHIINIMLSTGAGDVDVYRIKAIVFKTLISNQAA